MSSRRDFLVGAIAGAGVAAIGLPRIAFARVPTEKRLVFVVLRGAMDGLAALPPYGDPHYREVRGYLALPEPGEEGGMIPLDRRFALNAALAPIAPLFKDGDAIAFHAVATPYRDRSHFDGQDVLENGTATPYERRDGWLNRALELYGAGAQHAGLAVGNGVPLTLRGPVPVASWAPTRLPGLAPDLLAALRASYRGDPHFEMALDEGAQSEALAEIALGDERAMAPPGPGANAFAELAPAAGKLLAAADGPRVAVIECLGWDTHQGQGTVKGRMADTLWALARGIAGMKQSLGPAWRETVVMAATEFGRTARPNGTDGTDHGTATAAFLFGGALAGGRVIADWPGLDRLYQDRDLAPTRDVRAATKTVLRDHFEIPERDLDRTVFPESVGTKPVDGLMRP
ncbi:MAG TPA: DUF1501 domain-containing protein [Alphaproteobacteria bacterium]|nr:DUF1501 domain-containing protein [Alphaproteobacteria bacterium]